jgi:endonuclease I
MTNFSRKILLAALTLLMTGAFLGCDLFGTTTAATTEGTTTVADLPTTTETVSTTTAATDVTDVGIVLSGTWRTVYEFGESFDPDGLVVTLIRSDGSQTAIGEYLVFGFNSTTSGLKTVRIRYGSLEASFIAYVKEAVIAADIALELALPSKLVYSLGESEDLSGLGVFVVKSDGDRIALPESAYSVTGFTSDTTGLVTLTVTYDDLTATFPIYVREPATSGAVSLSVTLPTKTAYVEGESFDPSGMTVMLMVTGETSILLDEDQYQTTVPDMSEPGTYEIVVSALGMDYRFSVTVSSSTTTLDLIPYFDDAEGLEGEVLMLALREILVSTMVGVSYGDSRYILDETDADPGHAGYLIEFYTGASLNATWDDGITWNREHLWPQSKLGVSVDNAYIGVGSDLFNLAPANPSLNSSRGNKWFSTVTNTYSYNLSRTSIRGDLARGYLYMVVRYDYLDLIELAANQEPAVYQFGDLSTLLQWCKDDPVDDFERNRNNIIYSYQHDRNPFVDHPELIDLIWG